MACTLHQPPRCSHLPQRDVGDLQRERIPRRATLHSVRQPPRQRLQPLRQLPQLRLRAETLTRIRRVPHSGAAPAVIAAVGVPAS